MKLSRHIAVITAVVTLQRSAVRQYSITVTHSHTHASGFHTEEN